MLMRAQEVAQFSHRGHTTSSIDVQQVGLEQA